MRVKDKKNLKNKIDLENLLVSKNPHSIKPENINIQTINIDKRKNYINEEKKFWSSKNLKKKIYLNNSAINYNINNKKYYQNDEQISFFESSESERPPSPINSPTSSTHLTYTKKKKKQRRYQKMKITKYNYRNKNKYYNSINNISFNSNNNNSIFLASSSSSSSSDNDYDYSESSDISFRSKDNKRKRFYEEMMVEENELDYLKKSQVGIISSEEEDNNNSLDISNSLEENFNNEIERILIDIYNKNITLISSENYNEINKNNNQIQDTQKQIKTFLKRENLKINLLVLKSLSNKIKELIGKYKEKVFEIKEIKYLYEIIQSQRQYIINNQQIHFNNSVESNVATNSNSNSLNDSNNEEENLFNLQDEIVSKASSILLRELIHIKKTLKLSSKEIETIFRYPFSLLNENGKKIKFSVELMQNEEFFKTLLNDDIISSLLKQIKGIFNQTNDIKILKMIEELEGNCEHKNEMTRFLEYINNKLIININKNNENENIENKKNKNKKNKNKKKEIEIENNNINNNNNENEELTFKNIDELLNYINDETDSKKGKKKGKKGKKNKKQKKEDKKEEEKEIINNNSKDNYNDNNYYYLGDDFLKEFEDFKKDIEENSVYFYKIKKIIPCLSNDFLNNLSK